MTTDIAAPLKLSQLVDKSIQDNQPYFDDDERYNEQHPPKTALALRASPAVMEAFEQLLNQVHDDLNPDDVIIHYSTNDALVIEVPNLGAYRLLQTKSIKPSAGFVHHPLVRVSMGDFHLEWLSWMDTMAVTQADIDLLDSVALEHGYKYRDNKNGREGNSGHLPDGQVLALDGTFIPETNHEELSHNELVALNNQRLALYGERAANILARAEHLIESARQTDGMTVNILY
ncbi:hypothetical protein GC177_03205 [bacterium]|nr:hypothetical protein [bacterium]